MDEATHEIALPGCTPMPLAHYLKGLGVLRLVSEQAGHFFRSTLVQTLFYGIFSAWVIWSREDLGQQRRGVSAH